MSKYKIGQPVTAKYDKPPVPESRQYKVGQRVNILDDGKVVAVFEVETTNDTEATGTVIKTLGHKRRNNTNGKC